MQPSHSFSISSSIMEDSSGTDTPTNQPTTSSHSRSNRTKKAGKEKSDNTTNNEDLTESPIKIDDDYSNNVRYHKTEFHNYIQEPGDIVSVDIRKLQMHLSRRKKDILKLKSQLKTAQLKLISYEKIINKMYKKIAKKICRTSTVKLFHWEGIKTAHTISKIFEKCQPSIHTPMSIDSGEKGKCLYTPEVHRFAVALYFYSPRSYFYLSSLLPIFPNGEYIKAIALSDHVEKMFPVGVYCEEVAH